MFFGVGPSGPSGSVTRCGLSVGGKKGFGDVGEAAVCFQTMAEFIRRLREIRDNVEADNVNVERYVKELAGVTIDCTITKACGRMFEQEHLRVIAMV